VSNGAGCMKYQSAAAARITALSISPRRRFMGG
jgi:hypothetical protein